MGTTENEIARAYEILPELKNCLPEHTPEQIKELDESLRAHNMLHGIITCTIKGRPGIFLLDGHTRFSRAKELGVEVWEAEARIHFNSIDEAIKWVCKNQLGRRNLTVEHQDVLLGRLYNAEKKAVGANQHTNGRVGQIEPPSSTAERIGMEHGVSPTKVKRAAKKVEQLDAVGLIAAVNSRDITKISDAALREIAASVKAEPERKDEIVKEVLDEAKANNGKVTGRKRAGKPEAAADDDELDDPERTQSLEDFTKQISDLVFDARKQWDADFVAQLKRNVLEAFKMPLPETAKSTLPEPAAVIAVPIA